MDVLLSATDSEYEPDGQQDEDDDNDNDRVNRNIDGGSGTLASFADAAHSLPRLFNTSNMVSLQVAVCWCGSLWFVILFRCADGDVVVITYVYDAAM